jgi:hypothetical protein
MFIPSAIAAGNESPILPDADIPETLTRAQLEAHGAVARLREEPDESDAQIYESSPTSHPIDFNNSSEAKWWLATAEGAERYKTVHYDDESGQACKDNIDLLIKNVREKGILVPYVGGKNISYSWWIYAPDRNGWDANVSCSVEINGKSYLISMKRVKQEHLQHTQAGYASYKAAVKGDAYNGGEYNGYTPTAFTIGQTEYNGAFKNDDSFDTIYFYAIIDGWDVSIRGNQGVTQEEILNDFTQLEFKTEAVPSVILIIIIIIAAAIAVATAVILLKRKKKKSTN